MGKFHKFWRMRIDGGPEVTSEQTRPLKIIVLAMAAAVILSFFAVDATAGFSLHRWIQSVDLA